MQPMPDKDDIVPLRVDVSRELRTRLRTQASRLEQTMGQLLERLLDEPLTELELEGLEKAKKQKTS